MYMSELNSRFPEVKPIRELDLEFIQQIVKIRNDYELSSQRTVNRLLAFKVCYAALGHIQKLTNFSNLNRKLAMQYPFTTPKAVELYSNRPSERDNHIKPLGGWVLNKFNFDSIDNDGFKHPHTNFLIVTENHRIGYAERNAGRNVYQMFNHVELSSDGLSELSHVSDDAFHYEREQNLLIIDHPRQLQASLNAELTRSGLSENHQIRF